MISDRDQFDDFLVSRWPRLARLAYGLTGDRRVAEDIAQTALANAWAAWRRVSRADDPDAYLRRIVVNAAGRQFRRRAPGEPAPGVRDPAGVDGAGPAHRAGERSALLVALGELPPRQRAVIVLRFWEGLSDAQTASVLGCTARTVRSQAARALAGLRAHPALTEQAAP